MGIIILWLTRKIDATLEKALQEVLASKSLKGDLGYYWATKGYHFWTFFTQPATAKMKKILSFFNTLQCTCTFEETCFDDSLFMQYSKKCPFTTELVL